MQRVVYLRERTTEGTARPVVPPNHPVTARSGGATHGEV
ncbi:hypothetical protein Ae168Ps1_1295c [Pseudonocardia sp. Ae168_Ps1]|nr:hypothetical protein Ae150APs1_1292c [Pseudonocardia sp. Ae150A_Ps1]OLL78889.1 hypothetical protein Ae168Ps1_1295c [Pseudonocardia sp. Ae168_Ps1]OLL86972.1 hypothetical protein Ae263Ps1_4027 [Pseudonocardia sp. Ae263_Ps1]OLL92984.1 hypothetical protein Ae356Ps1_2881c [Pseudonocardia sp. Ae356_Ps1]